MLDNKSPEKVHPQQESCLETATFMSYYVYKRASSYKAEITRYVKMFLFLLMIEGCLIHITGAVNEDENHWLLKIKNVRIISLSKIKFMLTSE